MSDYLSHLARLDRRFTACGEPWQGWQAPDGDTGMRELPPHRPPTDRDEVRQCQACMTASVRNRLTAG